MNENKRLLFATLNAWNETMENTPNGAWWAILEEVVMWWNGEYKTNYDANSIVQEWVNRD